MREVNIRKLHEGLGNLVKDIPCDIIITGKIKELRINYKYDHLDLSRVKCNKIVYSYQEGESIKNHILPNSLKKLDCCENEITSLPELPNSLEYLDFSSNQLTYLADIQLPNSLEILDCSDNKLISLPNLPNSLRKLYCWDNQLKSFANAQLPKSLNYLDCSNNQLTSLPDFSHIDHKLELAFMQDLPISFITYNSKLKFVEWSENKIIIEGYPYNPITNQQELDQYMDFIFHKMNGIKSARK